MQTGRGANQVQKAESNVTPESEPEAKQRSKETPKLPGARELRITSRGTLVKAFSDNPQRATKEFGNLRWRFYLRVDRINETRLIAGVVFSGDVGAATIAMRSNQEVEKLSLSKPAIIEACVVDFKPGVWDGVHFSDGVFIEQAVEPERAPTSEITRDLTAASLNEIIEALDRGNIWAARYRKIRWSFVGTIVKKAAPTSLTHIINVPNVGKVEVGIPDGDMPPNANDRVELSAIISKLTSDEDGKPLLVFTYPKQTK